MPITPAIIPAAFLNPIVKQGAFDADIMNQINALVAAQDILVAQFQATGVGFAVFNTNAAVTLLPAGHPAGLYEVSAYMVITTLFATNTTETITLQYTDDFGANTTAAVISTGLTAGLNGSAEFMLHSTGATAITFKPGVTGSAATAGAAAYYFTVQRIF